VYIPPGKQQGTPLIPPREEHWHGGTADNVMCHLAMLESGDGGKYLAELDKEEQLGKYTLAELEEEEQGLDRLRRWYRELRSRDLLGIRATTDSATALKLCEERFDAYAEHVYAVISSPGD
jgi:hypothetical protein